jgi:hypothetical protein
VSSRHITHSTRTTALTATMLALSGAIFAAEIKSPTPADQALSEYAQTGGAERQGAAAAANYYYDRGVKAMGDGRMDDAIRDLTLAVDWQPQMADYRKALRLSLASAVMLARCKLIAPPTS